MSNFYRKRKMQQLVYSRAAIALLVIPIGFLGYAALGAYGKATDSGMRREAAEEELYRMEERQRALVSDIELLESDRGKEEALRERYQVGREGEHMLVLINDTADEPEPLPVSKPASFWERMFAIVF
jgi:cell division protein FtsB